jgi:hypothetical protein
MREKEREEVVGSMGREQRGRKVNFVKVGSSMETIWC